jgi:hypothetical protein
MGKASRKVAEKMRMQGQLTNGNYYGFVGGGLGGGWSASFLYLSRAEIHQHWSLLRLLMWILQPWNISTRGS